MRRNINRKDYSLVDGLTEGCNIVFVYNNYIELRHFSRAWNYPIQGALKTDGFTRRYLSEIGKRLLRQGFNALSPMEARVQISLGTLPDPQTVGRNFGDKLIRVYVRCK